MMQQEVRHRGIETQSRLCDGAIADEAQCPVDGREGLTTFGSEHEITRSGDCNDQADSVILRRSHFQVCDCNRAAATLDDR